VNENNKEEEIMEKIFVLLIILAFLVGTTGGEFTFGNLKPEDIEVEEEKITGNQNIKEEKTGSSDLYKIFRKEISGNASINLNSDRGDVFILFQEKITGNVKINIVSNRGDIHIKFEEAILGNAKINLEAPRGTVIFYNDVDTVGNADITINSENVRYTSGDPVQE
jgi:hypothetical protein